jgi:hypothetical protein
MSNSADLMFPHTSYYIYIIIYINYKKIKILMTDNLRCILEALKCLIKLDMAHYNNITIEIADNSLTNGLKVSRTISVGVL